MQSQEQLHSRFQQIGYSPNIGQIAIEELAESLDKDETVFQLLEGSVQNTLGFALATDLRIFYIGIDKHKNCRFEQLEYTQVKSIETREIWPSSSEILIYTHNGNELKVRGCEQEVAAEFVELVKMLTEIPS